MCSPRWRSAVLFASWGRTSAGWRARWWQSLGLGENLVDFSDFLSGPGTQANVLGCIGMTLDQRNLTEYSARDLQEVGGNLDVVSGCCPEDLSSFVSQDFQRGRAGTESGHSQIFGSIVFR